MEHLHPGFDRLAENLFIGANPSSELVFQFCWVYILSFGESEAHSEYLEVVG